MKRMIKGISLAAAVLILFSSVLAGCGNAGKDGVGAANTSASTLSTAQQTTDKQVLEPVELKYYFRGDKYEDDQLVWNEFNKKVKDKINATINFVKIDSASYNDKMKMLYVSGEAWDLCFTSSWSNNFWDAVAKGAFMELDDLIPKAAPELKNLIPDFAMDSGVVNGKQYGIPNQQIFATPWALMMTKEMAVKYGLDTKYPDQWKKTLKDIREIEPVLEQMKKDYPNKIPIKTFTGTNSFYFEGLGADETQYESISSIFGIKKGDKSYQVMDLTKTPERSNILKLQRDWFLKGYIRPDILTVKDDTSDLNALKYCMWPMVTKPGIEAELQTRFKTECFQIMYMEPFASANAATTSMYAISKNSKNAERALMYLQLINSDKDLFNTLCFGLEGTHYTKKSANEIDIPEDTKYKASAWMFGNQFNTFYKNGQTPGIWEETDKLNRTAESSILTGFVFNQEPVKSQVANIDSIVTEYLPIFSGAVDYSVKEAEFHEKLKKAGAEEVLAEIQKQVDEWAKSNGKK